MAARTSMSREGAVTPIEKPVMAMTTLMAPSGRAPEASITISVAAHSTPAAATRSWRVARSARKPPVSTPEALPKR